MGTHRVSIDRVSCVWLKSEVFLLCRKLLCDIENLSHICNSPHTIWVYFDFLLHFWARSQCIHRTVHIFTKYRQYSICLNVCQGTCCCASSINNVKSSMERYSMWINQDFWYQNGTKWNWWSGKIWTRDAIIYGWQSQLCDAPCSIQFVRLQVCIRILNHLPKIP